MSIHRSLLAAACAAALLAAVGTAHADAMSIDFNTFAVGQLPGGADARSAGSASQWYVPDNAATFGEVRSGVGRGGSAGLVVGNRGNGFDGVIDNVKSGRLADKAGETSVAPNNTFESSFWFRSASSSADAGFAFKTESWGTDRTTWLGFFASANGKIEVEASGINAAGDFTSNIMSTQLDWGTWYRVVTKIVFADGGPSNDLVEFSVFDESSNLVAQALNETTWEAGQRLTVPVNGMPYNGGQIVAPDSIGFQARFSTTGDTVYIDDVSWRSFNTQAVPEPAGLALVFTAGLLALGVSRRARRG